MRSAYSPRRFITALSVPSILSFNARVDLPHFVKERLVVGSESLVRFVAFCGVIRFVFEFNDGGIFDCLAFCLGEFSRSVDSASAPGVGVVLEPGVVLDFGVAFGSGVLSGLAPVWISVWVPAWISAWAPAWPLVRGWFGCVVLVRGDRLFDNRFGCGRPAPSASGRRSFDRGVGGAGVALGLRPNRRSQNLACAGWVWLRASAWRWALPPPSAFGCRRGIRRAARACTFGSDAGGNCRR